MELNPIFEVVRIKQEVRETSEPFSSYRIASPGDAQELAASFIADISGYMRLKMSSLRII
ncbi:hypothetical protein ACIQZI_22340 [Peribacillus sp. NPDC096379]|uniref:hypothetical protein n=1 Tax=Peribacillus sp. NPDC096379 TaxID=3364393 RepID=UPI003812B954